MGLSCPTFIFSSFTFIVGGGVEPWVFVVGDGVDSWVSVVFFLLVCALVLGVLWALLLVSGPCMAAQKGPLGAQSITFHDILIGNISSSYMWENPIFGLAGSDMGDQSSHAGGFRPTKVNGCLAKSVNRPIVVIPPASVEEDIEYLSRHSLICKYMGIQMSFPFLESWARRTWNPEGEMEVMLATNGIFFGGIFMFD